MKRAILYLVQFLMLIGMFYFGVFIERQGHKNVATRSDVEFVVSEPAVIEAPLVKAESDKRKRLESIARPVLTEPLAILDREVCGVHVDFTVFSDDTLIMDISETSIHGDVIPLAAVNFTRATVSRFVNFSEAKIFKDVKRFANCRLK